MSLDDIQKILDEYSINNQSIDILVLEDGTYSAVYHMIHPPVQAEQWCFGSMPKTFWLCGYQVYPKSRVSEIKI